MGSLSISKRKTESGPRYVVRYRLGGRAWPVEHAGSFKTLREAKIRHDLIAGEIAAGRDPRALLHAHEQKRTLASYQQAWRASRLDLDRRTLANYDLHWKRLAPMFAALTPDEVRFELVQKWIGENARTLTPEVLRAYSNTLKQVLDFAGAEPNPARDRRIRYPTSEQKITVPPSDKHVLAMLEQIPFERRLLYVFLEQDGGRIGEHVAFTWGDVDIPGSRILARPEAVKGRRGRRRPRWLQIPAWLMELLLDTCPPEDRLAGRPLFPGWPACSTRSRWRTGRCAQPARPPASLISIRTISATAGSRSGTGEASPPGRSATVPGRSRSRPRSRSTPTRCRSTRCRETPSSSC